MFHIDDLILGFPRSQRSGEASWERGGARERAKLCVSKVEQSGL
nr:MAG TPA: hypothetical protein [Caudoviricetes sp.]